ncbi:sulfurtransferase [Corynebacterium sp. UBA2622]|uniref:sulfurtransferase n=1 Tax=Corynebacterium sp. UBA2622 TaxID=1946393 RepID=UPI0025C4127E|nr:rhodanese-like domain-containing protein [Corynebacterium sp. UBA2622]
MSVFVPAEELRERIHSGRNQAVIAALWEPEEGKAWSKFQSEHIPTAMFCDPASELAGMPGRRVGRNPLPKPATLLKAVRKWGLENGHPTYIYDTGSGVFSARLWWTLRWLGIEDVHIVDGGFAAWDGAGYETVAGPGNIAVFGNVEIEPGNIPVATIDEVKEFGGLLIDARGANRYSGRRERLDLKAGHIPQAVNLPVYDLFDDTARKVKDVDYIRDRFFGIGITQNTDPADAIVYSGSGNHSALLLAAMEHAGLPVITHYIGGWSQWSGDHTNPVASDL